MRLGRRAAMRLSICLLMLASACSPGAADPVAADPVARPAEHEPGTSHHIAEADGQVGKSFEMVTALPPVALDPPQRIVLGRHDRGTFILDTITGDIWDPGHRPNGGRSWAPDGYVLAESGCCSGDTGLTIIDLTAGTTTRLVPGRYAMNVTWSPDGQQLAFIMVDAESSGRAHPVYVVNRDGTGLRQLSDPVVVIGLAWSADGQYIAVQQEPYDPSSVTVIRVVDARPIVTVQWIRTFADAWAWSPTGSELAWLTQSGYEVMDFATGARDTVRLENPADQLYWWDDGVHVLSADSSLQKAAYVLHHRTPDGQVYPLGPVFWDSENWSRDGSKVAYVSDGCTTGEFNVVVSNADGTALLALTDDGISRTQPVWHPDGNAIAFGGADRLVVAAVDGSRTDEYLTGYDLSSAPFVVNWSSDGRYVQFGLGSHQKWGYCFGDPEND